MTNRIKENINDLKSPGKGLADIESLINELFASKISIDIKQDLLKEIENIAFNKGIELPSYVIPLNEDENLNLNDTDAQETPSVSDEDSPIDGSGSEQKLEAADVEEETDEETGTMSKASSSYLKNVTEIFKGPAKGWIANYKRYYLFKIGQGLTKSEKTLFIHDNIPSPELVQRALDGFNNSLSLDEFINKLEDNESELWSTTHLCLLVLSDFSKMAYHLIGKSDLLFRFDIFKYYELIFEEEDARTYEYEGERLIQDMQSDVHVSLTNANLNKAEESLIKSFFPPKPSLVQYKLLKGGFSGSKVVEVSQAFSIPRPCKFIIKIGAKKDRKISLEEVAVKQWVSSLVSSYQTEKKENATHEALKYQFASIDGKRESMSFSDLFRRRHVDSVREIIDKVFNHDLFKEWENLQVRTDNSITIGDLYKDHLSIDKIFKEIKKIGFDKSENDCNKFESVLKTDLPRYVLKVCHGDLHSENIIIDDDKVFLIDFGMTSNTHCFIDYTTLEASIRFKLTPSYFPTKVLNDVDNHFATSFDTTDASLKEKIENSDLRKSYEIISKIRQIAIHKIRANAKTYTSNEELEINYLVSLFCISLRNVKYSDLNQKYALNFCRRLADTILAKLSKK